MKPIAIIMLGLSSLLAPSAAAQTPASSTPGARTAAPLPILKVRPSRAHAARADTGGGHRTVGYQENDITAAKFGSKHWWTVQGWQSGGSSGTPR